MSPEMLAFLEGFAHESNLDGPIQALSALAVNGVMVIFQLLALMLAILFALWSLGKLAWRLFKKETEKGEPLFVVGTVLVNAAIAVAFIGIPNQFLGLWYYVLYMIWTPLADMSALNGTYIISAIIYAALTYAMWVAGITLFAAMLAGYPSRERGILGRFRRKRGKKNQEQASSPASSSPSPAEEPPTRQLSASESTS